MRDFDNFEYALKEVLGIEGGFVNDKDDSGGKTNYGITESLAKQYGYDIETLTKQEAISIYYNEFWEKYKLDLIQNKDISKEVFEFGINAGMKIAIKTLQRAFNTLSQDILVEDGSLGPKTATKINSYHYPQSILKIQNILQGYYYILLAEDNYTELVDFKNHKETKGGKNKKFVRGWIEKRVKV